jgi:D-alanyl-D-alanine carboxypeptidase
VVVNKRRPLPAAFVPKVVSVPVPHTNSPQLRVDASRAVAAMFAGASRVGLQLASNSAYRSYKLQHLVYVQHLASLGREKADLLTAHPGCSEHQTGLAIDIGPLSGHCALATCMADTSEGEWLAAHAWQFGFLLRYPADKVHVTGYQYEPWHFRYLGRSLAAELHHSGVQTLEEFFGLPAAPSYPA